MSDGIYSLYLLLCDFVNCFIDLIYPPRCAFCGCLCDFGRKIHICHDCAAKIRYVSSAEETCKKCSRPIPAEHILCTGCQVVRHNYDVAYSCLIYENDVRRSVIHYKFNGTRYNYTTYANLMLERIHSLPTFPKTDMLVSTPLSAARLKKRGFDHTSIIANYISKRIRVPFKRGAIKKVKETPPQSRLSFAERFLSVKGSFAVDKNVNFKGKSVLLIDDIYTTGATADEISLILKRAGAEHIFVLTLCITPNINIGDELK